LLFEDVHTKELLCGSCSSERQIVAAPVGTILGREFDYEFSYSKKEGLRASARLGTASIALHVPQEEITKIVGV
jgi:hypothetical protein